MVLRRRRCLSSLRRDYYWNSVFIIIIIIIIMLGVIVSSSSAAAAVASSSSLASSFGIIRNSRGAAAAAAAAATAFATNRSVAQRHGRRRRQHAPFNTMPPPLQQQQWQQQRLMALAAPAAATNSATATATSSVDWGGGSRCSFSSSTYRWRAPSSSSSSSNKQPSTSTTDNSSGGSRSMKRPPRLYKRTQLRGTSKNYDLDHDTATPSSSSSSSSLLPLYRADRVLANRTGKSRKECFQLLQEKRVFQVVDVAAAPPVVVVLPAQEEEEERERDASEEDGTKNTNSADASGSVGSSDTAAVAADGDVASLLKQQQQPSVSGANSSSNSSSSKNNNNSASAIAKTAATAAAATTERLLVVNGPKAKLSMHTELRIDKYQVVPLPPPLLAVYHKPKWVLSVRRDPAGRPCLDNVFSTNDASAGNGGGQNKQQLLHPVGRLDYDTTGLLLFSSSGPLTQALLHPKHEIEKEYIATVTGTVKKDELRAVLAAGVRTGEGVHTAHLLSVEYPFTDQEQVTAYLQRIKAELPAEYNATDLKARGYLDIFGGDGVDSVDSENAAPLVTALSTVTLVVSEGKHRMVRRMLANTGHPVVSLHRARLGSIRLDSSQVPEGHTRQLTAAELKWAQQQLRQGGINNTVKKNQQPTAGPMPTKKVDRLEVDDE